MATKAQDTVPNLVKEGKLDEIFDRSAREKEHREFVAGVKANPDLKRSVEEIERLHEEVEQAPGTAAREAVDGLAGQVQKRPKTTLPGKRKEAPVAAPLPADPGDETVIDSRPPRTAEQDAFARHWMIRGAAIGLGIVLVAAFAIAFLWRDDPKPASPSAAPTSEPARAAGTGQPTAAATVPSATATAAAQASASEVPSASATAEATAPQPSAPRSSEPKSTAKASVAPPPTVTIPPLLTTPTATVPPPPSTSGKKPIFP